MNGFGAESDGRTDVKFRCLAMVLGGVYLGATGLIMVRSPGHANLLLLIAQHVLLLPALILWLTTPRTAEPSLLPLGQRLSPWTAYAAYALIAASLVWVSQGGYFQGDESAYRFQSRIFLMGNLYAPAPPALNSGSNEFRFNHHIIYQGRWFTKYPPGWPAVLAVGTAIGAEQLVNPLIGLVILALAAQIARLVFGEDTARLTLWLTALSPYFVLNCVGYLSHPLCAALLAGAILFCLRGVDHGNMREFVISSVLVGFAMLVRPFTAACVGATLTAATMWAVRRAWRRVVAVVAVTCTVWAGAAVALISYNHALVGSYWRSTYAVYSGTAAPVELNLNPIAMLSHLTLARWSLQDTLVYAFPFVFVMAVYGLLREREKRLPAWVLAGVVAALIAGYMLVTEPSGGRSGERYYFECFSAVAVLGARGVQLLCRRWNVSLRVAAGATLLLVSAQTLHFASFGRVAAAQVRPVAQLRAAIAELPLEQPVIFVKSGPEFSARDFNENAADWRKAPFVVLEDPGPAPRGEVVRILHRRTWAVLEYDQRERAARVETIAALQ